MSPTLFKHLRALAITVALVAHGVHALPLPRPLTHKEVQKDWRQDDIRMWRAWLASVGVDITQEQVSTFLYEWTGFWGRLHKTLKAPFRPIFKLTGTDQRWALFAAATEKPERLVVEYTDADGRTHILLRRLDPPYSWREVQFRYRRIRGIWDGVRDKPTNPYKSMTRWIARLVFAELPEAESVEVRLERQFSTAPWEPDDPEIEIRHVRTHKRENHAP
jgi:hypothetical protein